jgi:hypothetical protein
MNIKTLDSAATWDDIEDYAAGVSGAVVYFENPRLEAADASTKTAVITYYRDDESVPADLITALESKYYGYLEFRDPDLAFEFVLDYFPRRDELTDGVAGDPYWYQCFVVRQDGVIEYDNAALRKGSN